MSVIRNMFNCVCYLVGLLAFAILPLPGLIQQCGELREALASRAIVPAGTSNQRPLKTSGSGKSAQHPAEFPRGLVVELAGWCVLELGGVIVLVVHLRQCCGHLKRKRKQHQERSQRAVNQLVPRQHDEKKSVRVPSSTERPAALPQEAPPAPLTHDEAWMRQQAHAVLKSTRLKYRELYTDTWWATAVETHGYQVTLEVTVDGRCLALKVKTWLFFDRDMLHYDLPAILLQENATLQYGSYQLEEFQSDRMVTLGMVCDTQYLPTPLICCIGRNLMKTYQGMLMRLYARNIINLGPQHPAFGLEDDDDEDFTPSK